MEDRKIFMRRYTGWTGFTNGMPKLKPLTHSESIYTCNFAICTNKYRLQCPDTKAPGNTTEHEGYNACNEFTRVKLGVAHDLT